MVIKIKGKETDIDIIELKQYGDNVSVRINGDLIAEYRANGNYMFWGNKSGVQFEGTWKEK